MTTAAVVLFLLMVVIVSLFVLLDYAVTDEEIYGDSPPRLADGYTTEFVAGGHLMNDAIVIDCPVCFRTMWATSTCHHGQMPPPRNDDQDPRANPPRVRPVSERYKEKTRDRHRPRPENE
jgi:hypothetical protein